jgi:thiol:disulfide interchange protein DsbA
MAGGRKAGAALPGLYRLVADLASISPDRARASLRESAIERIRMKRRDFSAGLTAATLGLAMLDGARAQGAPVEGKQYLKLGKPVPIAPNGGKIDVVEFFSYECPHCNEFEPTLEAWVKRLPSDVNFHRFPVPFLPNYENFQHLYYTLETLNLVDAMQAKVFNAVHIEHRRLDKPDDIAAFATRSGLDAAKFMGVFNSFAVQVKVRQANQQRDAFNVNSIPTLAVQGLFTTSPADAGGAVPALQVADYLVQQVRGKR